MAGVVVNLFMGCELTSAIRVPLDQSSVWKQQQMLAANARSLTLIHHQKKEYVGFYLPVEELSLDQMGEFQDLLLARLKEVLPHHPITPAHIYILTQSMLS